MHSCACNILLLTGAAMSLNKTYLTSERTTTRRASNSIIHQQQQLLTHKQTNIFISYLSLLQLIEQYVQSPRAACCHIACVHSRATRTTKRSSGRDEQGSLVCQHKGADRVRETLQCDQPDRLWRSGPQVVRWRRVCSAQCARAAATGQDRQHGPIQPGHSRDAGFLRSARRLLQNEPHSRRNQRNRANRQRQALALSVRVATNR